jgi:hypothetical protein
VKMVAKRSASLNFCFVPRQNSYSYEGIDDTFVQ